MYKAYIFVKRGLVTLISYQVALILSIMGMFIGVIRFFFMAKFVGEGNSFPLLAPYGGDIMAYFITGVSFMSFVSVSLNSFSNAIREEQHMGTLEFLLMSETPLPAILTYSALWSFFLTSLNTTLVFVVIIFVFGMSVNINFAATMFVLIITVLCMSGIGLMSAGVIMVSKKGDPVTWIFSTLSGLLSGVIFPIQILPNFLQKISFCLPTTYALSALRKALLTNASLGQLQSEIHVLLLFILFTIPFGIYLFTWGFNKARRDGSLGEY